MIHKSDQSLSKKIDIKDEQFSTQELNLQFIKAIHIEVRIFEIGINDDRCYKDQRKTTF